ncbi:MAG: hypothetical protein AAF581_08365 [Planctomycetota bacterium]
MHRLFLLVSLSLILAVAQPTWGQCVPTGGSPGGVGVDLIVGGIDGVVAYGSANGFAAFAVGSTACNIGTADVSWLSATPDHPVYTTNVYRLLNNRIELIGMSWVFHGFFPLQQNGCGCSCVLGPVGMLGVGCSNSHSAAITGQQAGLGPHVDVLDPALGLHTGVASLNPPITDLTSRRLRIADADLDPTLNVGAEYFVEVQYLHPDDAVAGNGLNNCSVRRATVQGAMPNLNLVGPTVLQEPAIRRWQAQVPGVVLSEGTVAGGGRVLLGVLTTDLGNGLWSYEYALYNQNADAATAFAVPGPASLQLSAVDYRAGQYHSGEPQDNVDWSFAQAAGELRWQVAAGSNSSLGWSNMANFRFVTNSVPSPATATVVVGSGAAAVTVQVATEAPAVSVPFLRRGDCNTDTSTNLADAIFLLGNLFPIGVANVLSCDDACDANDDGALNLADAIAILGSLFGAPPMPLPGPAACGPDPTSDGLGCVVGC